MLFRSDDVPAVVGSFPEPFLDGTDGKRLPVRVECTEVAGYACRTVTARLRSLGVPAALAAAGGAGAADTLRVIVAPWKAAQGDAAVASLARGPVYSGVYARFQGGTLALLDQDGRVTRRMGASVGLIAATRIERQAPVWVVTGTDSAGVDNAARAFDAATLHDRFAVSVGAGGALFSLPESR